MNKTDFKEAITCIESHSQTSEGYDVETEAGTFKVSREDLRLYYYQTDYGYSCIHNPGDERDIVTSLTFEEFNTNADEHQIEDFLKDYFKDNWEKIYQSRIIDYS